jgi:ABC-type antimicrobial peptide transport system permease subunit
VLFGAIAVTIAIVGLYGVVAFNTAQRASEIAVRVALGARPTDIVVTVAGEALRAISLGLIVAGVIVAVAHRWVGGLLFQTSPSDPGIILAAATLLFATSALALASPIWQTMRQNPANLLRSE